MQPYYSMRIMAGVLGLLMLVVVPHVARGQVVCELNLVPCQGWFGEGCYDPAYATCTNGVICDKTLAPCAGRFGAGCYNRAYATCTDGVICQMPLRPCFGPHGASCYDPSRATCGGSSQRPLHRRW